MTPHNIKRLCVIRGYSEGQHVVTLQARALGASGGEPHVSIGPWSRWDQSERCALEKDFGLNVPPLSAVDEHAFICSAPRLMLPPLIHHTPNMSFCKHRCRVGL